MKSLPFFAVVLLPLLFAGCAHVENMHRHKTPMMDAYLQGRDAEAVEFVNDELPSAAAYGNSVMWQLEAGTLAFVSGRDNPGIQHFAAAEAAIEDYDYRSKVSARDVASEGAMLVTNLTMLPYRGYCRDRVALAFYKSLAFLGAGNESAFRAQLNRLRNAQKKTLEDYQAFFQQEKAEMDRVRAQNPAAAGKAASQEKSMQGNSSNTEFNQGMATVNSVAARGYGNFLNPAALFLSGLGFVRDGNWENARIEFERLHTAQPGNPDTARYLVTVLQQANRPVPAELQAVKPFEFPLDRDMVYVLMANGRGAAFRQIAIYFPIMTAWPMCEFYPARLAGVTATAGGRSYPARPLADMDGILAQEFKERLPGMITRIILSTAVKEAGKYAATYAASQADSLAGVATFVAMSAYEATVNTADTRTWETLPKEFLLTQFPMPADRRVRLAFNGRTADLSIPGNARSAIIFVNAPSPEAIKCRVLPFYSDSVKTNMKE